jgi:hypothetical protein
MRDKNQTADNDSTNAGKKHGPGGNILRYHGRHAPCGRHQVHDLLDRRVYHLGYEDETYHDGQGDQLEMAELKVNPETEYHCRDEKMDPYVPLRPESVMDAAARIR